MQEVRPTAQREAGEPIWMNVHDTRHRVNLGTGKEDTINIAAGL